MRQSSKASSGIRPVLRSCRKGLWLFTNAAPMATSLFSTENDLRLVALPLKGVPQGKSTRRPVSVSALTAKRAVAGSPAANGKYTSKDAPAATLRSGP
jgi:hypothetical protein